VADGFRALLRDATNLRALSGPLAAYLERFPTAQLPSVEEFLYWGRAASGPSRPSPCIIS
jgi:hypothetical protein